MKLTDKGPTSLRCRAFVRCVDAYFPPQHAPPQQPPSSPPPTVVTGVSSFMSAIAMCSPSLMGDPIREISLRRVKVWYQCALSCGLGQHAFAHGAPCFLNRTPCRGMEVRSRPGGYSAASSANSSSSSLRRLRRARMNPKIPSAERTPTALLSKAEAVEASRPGSGNTEHTAMKGASAYKGR